MQFTLKSVEHHGQNICENRKKKSQFLGFFRFETKADVRSTCDGDHLSQLLGLFSFAPRSSRPKANNKQTLITKQLSHKILFKTKRAKCAFIIFIDKSTNTLFK